MTQLHPPSWRLSLQSWLSLLALGLVLWLTITYAGLILEVLFVLFAALLLSLAIRPLADLLARRRVPRGVTVLGVYVGLSAVLALLGTLLVPVIASEVAHLRANEPALLQTALSRLKAVPALGQGLPSIEALVQNLAQRLDTIVAAIIGAAAGLGQLTLDLVVVLILAYFFAADAGFGRGLLLRWVPPHYRDRAEGVLARLRHGLTRWVWAQVAIAAYFALVFSLGLTLLGVPFALTIALVGGVLEIVPYVGGVVALLLALLSALTVNPWLALWVMLFYLVVAQVETHIIAPAFYGRAMGLRPAVVLVALLVGAKARGVLGVLFAVPVAVVLAALLQEVQTALIAPEPEPAAKEEPPSTPILIRPEGQS